MKKPGAALGALSLVVATIISMPAAARPSRLRIVQAPGTRAPVFVLDVSESPRKGGPVRAARAHLDANSGRYRVDEDRLRVLEVMDTDEGATVRFLQTHMGHDVFGAQYLVHMSELDGGFATYSVNGNYFTELSVDTAPRIGPGFARRLAVRRTPAITTNRVGRHGLVVLPIGRGMPVYHFTLWGHRLAGGQARHEVFINSLTGSTVLGYNNIQTDGQATGTGVDAHGNDHELNLYQRASIYELRDQGRAMFASNGGEITTHDAHGAARDMTAPTDQNIVTDDDTSFIGNPFSINGSVDAHWLAGQTYEYFRSLGRNSLDNNGMDIVSLIDAADSEGGPLFNASWNGTYVTYGNPDSSQLYPFSAAADVVAHELTHGVTDFSAGLISLGQSGAMNEAYSDYFGNALDVNLSGQPMDEPGVGFIGEDLCKVPDPDNFSCPVRNLNTTRAVEDYIYFLADFDNGGVHINSPIYGAALWDIREQLGGPAADLLVYKALTEFTTPLATFTDGRNAVLAAADALGYSGAQKQAVDAAFDERGIVAGWDSADGSDALTLIPNHTPLGFEISPPRVSGARFITGHYADLLGLCCAPEEIYVGRVDGTGDLNKVGQDDEPGTLNDELPDLSGKRAVWAHLKDSASGPDFNVSTRVLGGRAKSVAKGDGWQWHPAVDDDLVAWEDTNHESTDIWARRIGKRAMRVTRSPGDELRPDVSGDWIAYWDPPEGKGLYRVRVENVKTGKTTSYSAGDTAFLSPPSVSNKYVYWYQDQNFIDSQDPRGSIMKARLGSEVAKTLVPEFSGRAPYWGDIASLPVVSGNDRFVAYSDEYGYLARIGNPGSFPASETGRDVWVLSARGGDPKLVTCNRGDQGYPAIGVNQRVVWMDSALGRTDLVTRASPPGSC